MNIFIGVAPGALPILTFLKHFPQFFDKFGDPTMLFFAHLIS